MHYYPPMVIITILSPPPHIRLFICLHSTTPHLTTSHPISLPVPHRSIPPRFSTPTFPPSPLFLSINTSNPFPSHLSFSPPLSLPPHLQTHHTGNRTRHAHGRTHKRRLGEDLSLPLPVTYHHLEHNAFRTHEHERKMQDLVPSNSTGGGEYALIFNPCLNFEASF
jgi:hypothetical protein